MTISLIPLDAVARPPTPPKDHDRSGEYTIENINEQLKAPIEALNTQQITHPDSGISTPPHSSPISTKYNSSALSKKVDFQRWTTQHNGPSPQKCTPLRPLPQTRRARPLKSILKANSCYTPTPEEEKSSPGGYFDASSPVSVPKMLDSVKQLLLADDLTLRLDGYQTLNGALKAFSNFPDEMALRNFMPQIQRYILRDVCIERMDTQTSNLITQALKLSAAMFTSASISPTISNDFKDKLLDRALEILSKDDMNKAITLHYMYLLASPDFNPRNMTAARIDVLLSRLNDIQTRVSGSSVVAVRLVIYQRLMERQTTSMISHCGKWIENIFHACLSSQDETCRRAIESGLTAAKLYGSQQFYQKAIMDLFATPTQDDRKFGQYFTSRLEAMISDSSKAQFVLQIWSFVILSFRSRRIPISKWTNFFDMLNVYNKCFNSSRDTIRIDAYSAWNKLVLAADLGNNEVKPDDKLPAKLIAPFISGGGSRKEDTAVRKASHAGLLGLLYHAFQPGQSHARLDAFWQMYVVKAIPPMLKVGGRDGALAAAILRSLFISGKKPWNADRALSTSPTCVDELPRLDPLWLRSRLPDLVKWLEMYFGKLCSVEEASFDSPWQQLMLGVASAGATDVIASMETKEAIVTILTTLKEIWSKASQWIGKSSPDPFITNWSIMTIHVIDAFSPIAFLQESLILDIQSGQITVRASKGRNLTASQRFCSPLAYVLKILATPNEILYDIESIVPATENILNLLLRSDTASLPRLKLLHNALTIVADSRKGGVPEALHGALSNSLLLGAAKVLETGRSSLTKQADIELVRKEAVAVLTGALILQPGGLLPESWSGTFELLAEILGECIGPSYVQLGLVLPLVEAAFISGLSSNCRLQVVQIALSKAADPIDSNSQAKALKLMHGTVTVQQRKSLPLDPMMKVVLFISIALETMYADLENCADMGLSLLQDLLRVIEMLPASKTFELMKQSQRGLAMLLKDGDGLLNISSESTRAIRRKVLAIWKIVLQSLQPVLSDATVLQTYSPLLEAGLLSRHRPAVNSFIETWNTAMSEATAVEYPAELRPLLAKLAENVELELPGIEADELDLHLVVLPAFAAQTVEDPLSDDEQIVPKPSSTTPRAHPISHTLTPNAITPASAIVPSSAIHTPPSKAHPLPKLRHEDSQIEFVRVDDLPSGLTSDGTQGLTEHQQEVNERQRQDARIFPQISSSPVPPSTGKNLIRDRVHMDMSPSTRGPKLSTPEPNIDEQSDVDDFMGSSPTVQGARRREARSSSQASHRSSEKTVPSLLPELVEVDMSEEVPSSPPEMEDDDFVDPDATTYDVHVARSSSPPQDETVERADVAEEERMIIETNEQPNLVTTGRQDGSQEVNTSAHDEANIEVVQTGHAIEVNNADQNALPRSVRDAHPTSTVLETPRPAAVLEAAPDVADTLLDAGQNTTLVATEEEADTTESRPKTLKRKNSITDSVKTPQKKPRKTYSGWRASLSNWFGSSGARLQDDRDDSPHDEQRSPQDSEAQIRSAFDDEEMQDCIVVATQPDDDDASPIGDLDARQTVSQPTSGTQPIKRKPGRPRKSQNVRKVAPARLSTPTQRGRPKRVSPSIAGTPVKAEIAAARRATASTSPVNTRRMTRSSRRLDAETASVPASSQVDETVLPQTPQPITDVASPSVGESIGASAQLHDEVDAAAAAAAAATTSAANAAGVLASTGLEQTQPATPRTIIGRLRDLLGDVRDMGKKLVLGSKEQMEIKDMLFDLGIEVHAAAARGR